MNLAVSSDSETLGAELGESLLDALMHVVELALHLILGRIGGDKLHGDHLVHHVTVLLARQEHLDLSHRHLLLRALLGLDDGADAAVVEQADGLHHADCLPQGAVVVMLGEGVLLEELVLDDIGGL